MGPSWLVGIHVLVVSDIEFDWRDPICFQLLKVFSVPRAGEDFFAPAAANADANVRPRPRLAPVIKIRLSLMFHRRPDVGTIRVSGWIKPETLNLSNYLLLNGGVDFSFHHARQAHKAPRPPRSRQSPTQHWSTSAR